MASANLTGDRFTIITGGPGTGKTSLIAELRRRGFGGTVEAGRAIIIDQNLIGGHALQGADAALFAELMLAWEMRSYRMAELDPAPAIFFDRGIPELTGYYRMLGIPVPAHVRAAASVFRYRPKVFLAPAWRAIYTTDSERTQDFADAIAGSEGARVAYKASGYHVIRLPLASVEERADFVLESR
ncbi:MAG: AAA family ATPase [Nocardiopsaceae bacterium]|nr:AAA family ATPase [Nocardiopsaceae bacterium]